MQEALFYVLKNTQDTYGWEFACRLLGEIYAQQKTAWVYLNDVDRVKKFDALLWTFDDIAFIPHQVDMEMDKDKEASAPIVLIPKLPEGDSVIYPSYVLNLSLQPIEIPHTTSTLLLEIVPADPAFKQASREKYKQYREKNYVLNNVDVKGYREIRI